MAQFLTIGRHIECAIQTELVVELELALIEGSNLVDFSTILSYARQIQKDSQRCQGQRPCRAKNRMTQSKDLYSYDFPKLHHSSPNSFGANAHLRQI